jgi:predicted Zn-dependent peptidase
MIRYFLVAFCLAIFSGGLMASVLPKYESKTLDNGLEVVVIPLKKNSVITTDVFYKVGSRDEVMGKSGIAHMLEHLNFKSTKNLKAGEYDEIVKGFGGVNNASTSFDYTHYYINSSKENLSKSLGLLAELMANLKLNDKEFQPERLVVAEERLWRTDNNPMGYLYFNLFNTAFVYHPYHWMPIGFMDDIQSWSIDDIKSFHKKYYAPNNAVLVVAGDVNAAEVFKDAQEKFGSIPKGPEITERVMREPDQHGERRAVLYKDSAVEMLAIAYKIPNFASPDMVGLNVISELLSSGKSSRLNSLLVDKKRLVNAVHAYPLDQKDPGIFLILAVCNEGIKAETVEAEILEEIEKLKKSISQKELDKVKTNTRADFIFNLENSSHVADLYGSYFAKDDIKPLLEYEDQIASIKTDEIKRIAKKYLINDTKTTIILRSKEK